MRTVLQGAQQASPHFEFTQKSEGIQTDTLFCFTCSAFLFLYSIVLLSDADETAFLIVSQLRAIRRAVCRHMLCNLLNHFGRCDFRQTALQHTLVLHGQIDRNKTIRYAAILIPVDLEQAVLRKAALCVKTDEVPVFVLSTIGMQIGWTAVRTIAIRLVHFRGNDGLARVKLQEQAAEIVENTFTPPGLPFFDA